ncbi:hypothetical protein HELRODRAFT_163802 [Helobdella robusta]|uniref:CCHC-type domain-containing protein n=1 Tax=Helobdella robusta TaxID=6412 RepID=T1EUH5_HELRO|nr:hypothetical protein HELRODRAFT_163802 [Helobdella robusta]ESN96706.1 hypothetical protein HELRODRAFT_163802 [Helobdella robusta]
MKNHVELQIDSAKQASKADEKLHKIRVECSCLKLVLEQKSQDYGAPNCWNCEERGHLRRDCKKRPRNNYCHHCAATWHKRLKGDPAERMTASNKEAGNYLKANFVWS